MCHSMRTERSLPQQWVCPINQLMNERRRSAAPAATGRLGEPLRIHGRLQSESTMWEDLLHHPRRHHRQCLPPVSVLFIAASFSATSSITFFTIVCCCCLFSGAVCTLHTGAHRSIRSRQAFTFSLNTLHLSQHLSSTQARFFFCVYSQALSVFFLIFFLFCLRSGQCHDNALNVYFLSLSHLLAQPHKRLQAPRLTGLRKLRHPTNHTHATRYRVSPIDRPDK